MKLFALFVVALAALTGCAARAYGHLTCDGKCELVIDREVRELETMPQLPKTKD
jgi:hypothetical protein